VLWILSTASIFLALKTSDEPVVDILKNTRIESLFQKLPIGNTIVFDLSVGFLVTVIFYLLVVWFPDRRRKNLIKKNMKEQYRSFKEDTIVILLSACQGSYKSGLPKNLAKQVEFRKFVKEAVSESQERWHVVLNGLNDRLLKDLLVELEILMNEVSYILNNVNVEDPNVFSFFKRLSQEVYKLKNTTMEYDDVKQLSHFLWELFSGWSFIDGYREDDIVSVMIEKI
jgi:hypothetical protein